MLNQRMSNKLVLTLEEFISASGEKLKKINGRMTIKVTEDGQIYFNSERKKIFLAAQDRLRFYQNNKGKVDYHYETN